MQSVLITGGSGYLGRGLVRRLLAWGVPRVCVYSRDEAKQAAMRDELHDDPRMRWLIGDVRDLERLRRAMRGVDTVIHAAALKRVEVGEYNADEMAATNVGGSQNVITAAMDAGVQVAVLVSSDKAYQPVNAYGASKFMAEKLWHGAHLQRGASGPAFVAVRYGNVAGSTGSVIPRWRAQVARGARPTLTTPDATRFWMRLDEAVALVLHACDREKAGRLLVPDLPAFRMGDLAEAMGIDPLVVGMGPSEKLHESMDEDRCSADAPRLTVEELREALSAIPA